MRTNLACSTKSLTTFTLSLTAIVVDDMLMASKPVSANDNLLAHLRKHFRMKDLGEPRFVLGMHVSRPSLHHITVSQSLYIRKVAEKFKLTHSRYQG